MRLRLILVGVWVIGLIFAWAGSGRAFTYNPSTSSATATYTPDSTKPGGAITITVPGASIPAAPTFVNQLSESTVNGPDFSLADVGLSHSEAGGSIFAILNPASDLAQENPNHSFIGATTVSGSYSLFWTANTSGTFGSLTVGDPTGSQTVFVSRPTAGDVLTATGTISTFKNGVLIPGATASLNTTFPVGVGTVAAPSNTVFFSPVTFAPGDVFELQGSATYTAQSVGGGLVSLNFVPEPSTGLTLGCGLLGLAARRRHKMVVAA